MLLTSSQSAFAIAILARFRFSLPAAGILFLLFATHLVFTVPEVRWSFAGFYLFLALALLLADGGRRRGLWAMRHAVFSTAGK